MDLERPACASERLPRARGSAPRRCSHLFRCFRSPALHVTRNLDQPTQCLRCLFLLGLLEAGPESPRLHHRRSRWKAVLVRRKPRQREVTIGQLQQPPLPLSGFDPEAPVAEIGCHTPLRGTLDEALLNQEWLINFLNGVGFLPNGYG